MPDGLTPLSRPAGDPVAEAGSVRLGPVIRSMAAQPAGRDPLTALGGSDALALRPAKGTIVAVAAALQAMTLPVPIQAQKGNACGTTSLSMVLNHYRAPAATADVGAIDAAIRPSSRDGRIDSFTAPIDLVRYARRAGFNATLHQHATPDDLRRSLEQGVPPIILYDWGAPHGNGLHYVVVSGFRTQDGQQEWQLSDPSGQAWYIDEAELLRRWSNLHCAGVAIPYDRTLIAVAPRTGLLRTPMGTTKAASEVILPAYNGSRVVDLGASVATWGIGVGATAYDAAQWVSGGVAAGAAALADGWRAASSAVGGLLR